ncbi:MAG: hypothetical protein ACRDZR_06025 [Acidimicrobiales bacterium]
MGLALWGYERRRRRRPAPGPVGPPAGGA